VLAPESAERINQPPAAVLPLVEEQAEVVALTLLLFAETLPAASLPATVNA